MVDWIGHVISMASVTRIPIKLQLTGKSRSIFQLCMSTGDNHHIWVCQQTFPNSLINVILFKDNTLIKTTPVARGEKMRLNSACADFTFV